jgi:hypothetical protein
VETKVKTISLKLKDSLLRKLERKAKERGQNKSEVVRAALERFLDGAGTVTPGSALAAALPWVGCAEGPRDLSTNRKYLEGYGK